MKFGVTTALSVSAVMLAISLGCGCATQSETGLEANVDETTVAVKGVPGGVKTTTMTLVAQVVSIDYTKRVVTLKDEKGNRQSFMVGPEAVNFDQVRQGDQVRVAYQEEIVVYLKPKEANTGASAGGAAAVAKAQPGEKPAGLVAGTVEVTAVVAAVDLEQHKVTLRYHDGSTEVVPVRPDVALRQDHVGREVVIQVTTAIALAVDKL